MEEEWKEVIDYPGYFISNFGNIKGIRFKDRLLKQHQNHKGYFHVGLNNENGHKKFGVHRLVALAFLEKIEGKGYVDHIDRNKQNNKLDNLRWISNAENIRNQSKRNGYSSKYKGVSFDIHRNKWCAKMKIYYSTYNLGRYNTEEEAALAYNNFIIDNAIDGAILNEIKQIDCVEIGLVTECSCEN